MSQSSRALTEIAWSALGGKTDAVNEIAFTAMGGFASAFPVADIAAAAIATAGLAVAELAREAGGQAAHVTVDRRLSSMWFGFSLRPIDWRPPRALGSDRRRLSGSRRLGEAAHERAASPGCGGARSWRGG